MISTIVFNAPSANDAYAQAPDLDAEALTVAELLADLDPSRRPTFLPALTHAEEHEVFVRAAALADRLWWADRTPENLAAAEQAAEVLIAHDRQHPAEATGPIPPHSIEWGAPGGPRAYARQEYLGWLIGPITESCGTCQGETCRQCAQPATGGC